MNRKAHIGQRVAAWAISALLVVCLAAPLFTPGRAQAAQAGADLEVRVGYFGDDKDYRRKAVLTRSDMEALSQGVYEYSNVTRVGTVMGTVARGPTIYSILEAAGIDESSVQMINLRTTDGKEVNNWFVSLNMDQWVRSTRYYYPFLRSNYERVEDPDPEMISDEGMASGKVRPKDGALRGAKIVPAILAIESVSTKDPDEAIDASMMNEDASYRFCTGQSKMEAGVDCADYSSMNSAQWVFGIDVQLYGTPADPTGLELSLSKSNLVVGSKAQITYKIRGADLFDDKVVKTLTWKSSDPSIATVDSNGVVTILKKGKVTITAKTSNGISKSVTINAKDKTKKKQSKQPEKKAQPKQPEKKVQPGQNEKKTQNIVVTVPEPKKTDSGDDGQDKRHEGGEKDTSGLHEILLEGDMYDREEMDAAATPLDEQQRSPLAAACALGGTGVCLGAGGLIRFFKYLKEVR